MKLNKFKKALTLLAITAILGLSGCGADTEATPQEEETGGETQAASSEKIVFSNLTDDASRNLLEELFESAGLEEGRRQVFWKEVDAYNEIAGEDNLHVGMESGNIFEPKYDPYELQELWDGKNPEFPGYNCRITAFSLMDSEIQIADTKDPKDAALFLDLESLKERPEAVDGNTDRFRAFYSDIPTELTKDVDIHVKKVEQFYMDRGITFSENERVSLISIYFHNDIDDPSVLQIGHTGLLFQGNDDNMYFLEKVAFQEPYQLVKVKDRKDLNRYLMTKYDVSYNQPTAKPFIMENDHLMDGYGPLE